MAHSLPETRYGKSFFIIVIFRKGKEMIKHRIRWIWIFTVLMSTYWGVFNGFAQTGSLKIKWDSNTESDLEGYKIHFGTQSRNYNKVINVGKVTEYTVSSLTAGITYYFAVTAYDTASNESGYSTEVTGSLQPGDTELPRLVSASISDESHLDLEFSENIIEANAEDAENYKISDGIQVESATLNANKKSVRLTTTKHLKNHQYTVTVNGIEDEASNVIAANTTAVYTLVFVDNTPPVIVKSTMLDLDLIEILFNEQISQASAELGGNYVINGGVQVVGAQLLIDGKTVQVKTTAHLRGYTYTMTINNIRDLANNPIASNSTTNYYQLLEDLVPPQVVTVTPLNKNSLRVDFNEAVEKSSAETSSNYSISGGISVLSAKLENEKFITLSTSEHQYNQVYTITINNVRDLFANQIQQSQQRSYELVAQDVESPRISMVKKQNLNQIELVFTEPVEEVSAEAVVNYHISGNVQIQNALLLEDGTTVLLGTSAHERNVTYTLTINNVRDKATPPNAIAANSSINYTFENIDDISPTIAAISIIDPKRVEITFSEQITRESAENINHYLINNGIVIVGAELLNDLKIVALTTSTHLSDLVYTISITGIADRATPPNTIEANTVETYIYEAPDTTPPEVVSAEILSDTKVQINFSEQVEAVSAENIANYSIDKGIQVQTAVLDINKQIVNLTTSVHPRGNTYNLKVDNVYDLADDPNKINTHNTASYYHRIVDLTPPVINRFTVISNTEMKIEFSEPLSPASATSIQNYSIDNGVQVLQASLEANQIIVNLKTTTHQAGQLYTITINNISDLASIPNTIKPNTAYSYLMSSFDNEKPTVLSIKLLRENELELVFSEEIEETSAENINHYNINNNIQVYTASLLTDGVTVHLNTSVHQRGEAYLITLSGIQDVSTEANVIIPNTPLSYHFDHIDDAGPRVLSVLVHNLNQIEVVFDEQVDVISAENTQNYFVDKGIEIQNASLGNNLQAVFLTTSSHLKGILYTLEISGIQDLSENRNAIEPRTQFTYFIESQDLTRPKLDSVRISSASQLIVYFSEAVAQNSAETVSNYSIDRGIQVVSAGLMKNQREVKLQTTTHTRGSSYRLSVGNVQDIAETPNTIEANSSFLYLFAAVDVTPPEILAAELVGTSLVKIEFSERIERISAEKIDNYAISNNIEVLEATLDETETIVTLGTTKHEIEGRYVMTVNNIHDLAPIPNFMDENSHYSYSIIVSNILKNISLNHYQLDSLNVGEAYYVDRAYKITELPDEKQKLLWLKTANSDRWRTDTEFLSFQVEKAVKVYVGYDSRALNVPYWLQENFTKTKMTVQVSDVSHAFEIWERTCDAGEFTLGGNLAKGASGAKAMYTIMIEAPGDDQPIEIEPGPVPTSFQLYPNYPNPFNGGTQIRFDLPNKCRVKLVVYNILGQEVAKLADHAFEAGQYNIPWDGRNENGMVVANGVYFASLHVAPFEMQSGKNGSAQTFRQIRKMTYLK
jgi:TolB-like protein